MNGESSFHAHAERKTANGKALPYAAVLFSDYNALEILNSFLGAFDNLKAYPYGIAHVERGYALFHTFLFNGFNQLTHNDFSSDLPSILAAVCRSGIPEVLLFFYIFCVCHTILTNAN